MIHDKQYERLPKNVKNYISKLEADISYYKQHRLKEDNNATSIRLRDLDEDIPVQDRYKVVFETKNGPVEAYVSDKNQLEIRASGFNGLVVKPQSANLVVIETSPR